MFKIDIYFDLTNTNRNTFGKDGLITRAYPEHPEVVKWDGYYKTKVLGLCLYRANNVRELFLIPNRLKTDIVFQTTAAHELGHYLWLMHIKGKGMMHAHNFGDILFPTLADAKEFAPKFDCRIEDLRYFFI